MSHTDRNILQQKLDQAKTKVIIGSKYRHTKTNGEYIVKALGIREDNESIVVVYEELSHPEHNIWIRSLEGENGWLTPTKIDGKTFPRFTKIN